MSRARVPFLQIAAFDFFSFGLGGSLRTLLVLGGFCTAVSADQSGDFTFTDNGSSITITDYPDASTGAVVIPDTINSKPVTVIGASAFAQCSQITSVTIPATVTTINTQAFLSCASLVSVSVPSSVTTFGTNAFNGCSSLANFMVPPNVTSISGSLFYNCSSLVSVTIPVGVTSIGSNAFYGCSSLASISFPSTVTTISSAAFYGCNSLTSVALPTNPSYTSISSGLFRECLALASVTIPSNVTTISSDAFRSCPALSGVTIPSSVKSIGSNSFNGCTALTSVSIPSSVTTINGSAFAFCKGLTGIAVDEANSNFSSAGGVLFDKGKLTLIQYPLGVAGAYEIPATVTSISSNAFASSMGLTGVTIPSGVAAIGSSAFSFCNALTAITVDAANVNFSSSGGVLFNFSKSMLIQYPAGLGGAYTIPSSVTSISANAFASALGLTGVTIPSGVTLIGSGAFSGCSALTTVALPSSMTTIELNLFANCSGLTEVMIPGSVTSVGNTAFASCGSLVSATFGGSAPSSFGNNVFQAAAPSFKIRFNPGAVGFTTPFWNGYPTEVISSLTPVQTWLQANALPTDSSLGSDANGDGVSLLMAYALNLDPSQNLSGHMPRPVLAGGQMSLSFYSGAIGVTYVVQASSDLVTWSAEGVTMTAPDANQMRTATVDSSESQIFMRLVASY